MAAQIMPDPLDRIELRAVGRQRQQGDIARYEEPLAAVPAGPIEDHHGMAIAAIRLLISPRWGFMARVLQIGMISAAALACDAQTAANT